MQITEKQEVCQYSDTRLVSAKLITREVVNALTDLREIVLLTARWGFYDREDGGTARGLTGKPHKIAPTGGSISGFQLPGRTAKHLAAHYAVHSIV
ncbi:Uncharacterized protein DBV15_11476 [Temnothorax longispinosus]|uniref:Uncharacterized protein n=1 Tax=Temnothorax longispinosus TaxID=300112 RepID=A0A4S2KA87_9HYME|nr:Uncharacterized protein DBV15_11476 [Temnothorax longispinosus]